MENSFWFMTTELGMNWSLTTWHPSLVFGFLLSYRPYRWQCCWWLRDVGDLKLDVGDRISIFFTSFECFCDQNGKNRDQHLKSCQQHTSSPTSVTNIDVTALSDTMISENEPCLTILNFFIGVLFWLFKLFYIFDKFKCKRVLIKSLLRNVCSFNFYTLMYSYCINALLGSEITYLRRCLNVRDRHGLRRPWTKILIDVNFIQGCTYWGIYAPSADSIDLSNLLLVFDS